MTKKILFILVIIFSLFLIGFLSYIFIFAESEKSFIKSTIEDEKKEIQDTGEPDEEKYSNDIVSEVLRTFEFSLIVEDDGIEGSAYIDKNGYLYLRDYTNKKDYKLSEIKFNTLKAQYNNGDGLLSFYALSKDNKIYYIYLGELDIEEAAINIISTDFEAKNFTKLKFKNVYDNFPDDLIVLSTDGKLYDAITGLRYADSILTIGGKYFVYEDNTFANSDGNLIKDGDGNLYKIKYYFDILDNNGFLTDTKSIIITEDNKISYIGDYQSDLYVYTETIQSIKYDIIQEEANTVKITIDFGEGDVFTFDALYYSYYGI